MERFPRTGGADLGWNSTWLLSITDSATGASRNVCERKRRERIRIRIRIRIKVRRHFFLVQGRKVRPTTEPGVKRGTPYIPPRRSENQQGYPPQRTGSKWLHQDWSPLQARQEGTKRSFRMFWLGVRGRNWCGIETPGALVGLIAQGGLGRVESER